MANQLRTNPMVLDTASTSVSIRNTPTRIRSMVWSGYLNPTDRLLIKDGRAMADASGPTTLFDITGRQDMGPVELCTGEGAWIMDFMLYQIDNGILTVML